GRVDLQDAAYQRGRLSGIGDARRLATDGNSDGPGDWHREWRRSWCHASRGLCRNELTLTGSEDLHDGTLGRRIRGSIHAEVLVENRTLTAAVLTQRKDGGLGSHDLNLKRRGRA